MKSFKKIEKKGELETDVSNNEVGYSWPSRKCIRKKIKAPSDFAMAVLFITE